MKENSSGGKKPPPPPPPPPPPKTTKNNTKTTDKAEKQKRNFRHVEYEINTTGKFDIEMGDYFKFKHPRLIPDAPIASGTISNVNFIKLVAKRIEYSITKPVDGKGGFLRKILGVRRFV